MALRHSGLHLARDVGQGFAGTILGAHTYVWAWVIHWAVLLVAGVLLLLLRGPLTASASVEPGRAGRFAMGLLVVMAGANAVQAFASTGPPPFIGQSDPVRLSLDPRHWVWSMDAWRGPVSWRGSWTIPAPDPAAADPDPAHGPLVGLPALDVLHWEVMTAPLDGKLTGLAVGRDRATGGAAADDAERVLTVTDRRAIHVLDGEMSRVLHRVVPDRGYSIDLSPFAGATFLGGDTMAVLATNKSYLLLRLEPGADLAREWRHFRETDGGVTELRRGRFATVRARQMYALALAYDPVADELITVSVPSPRHRRLVVSRFDRGDLTLSSEFVARLGPGLAQRDAGRGLGEYVVTAADVDDGLLYVVSAAYSTILVIDLGARTVTAAYAVPGLADPVGLAVRGQEVMVAQGDGRIAVLSRPAGEAPGDDVRDRE
jgi:hypothetical protein